VQIKVLLVDDHGMIRSGLRALLSHEADLTVAGEAEDGRTAVKKASELSPDVVVMDLRMPDLNGIEATRQIHAVNPGIKIVALSANSDRRSVTEMLRAGAQGYVLKAAAFEELVAAIRAVMGGEIYLSPSITGVDVADFKNNGAAEKGTAFADLSAREREVLQLIAEGKATKEVAAALHVSIKTAETHRRNVMEKLKLDSVAELTKYAIREGITSL
jgi:DNA-binding NarL/FixJ family response regulator